MNDKRLAVKKPARGRPMRLDPIPRIGDMIHFRASHPTIYAPSLVLMVRPVDAERGGLPQLAFDLRVFMPDGTTAVVRCARAGQDHGTVHLRENCKSAYR